MRSIIVKVLVVVVIVSSISFLVNVAAHTPVSSISGDTIQFESK